MVKKAKRRIISEFDADMIDELVKNGDIKFDIKGRARGFSNFVKKMYMRKW